ncbi:TetR/AcrR family transcriptional regulator [Leucobacter chinensis]|uniref:TetR/AcrR family transcriptional regulator n=1 Tax=Leucobacter chinensis TaxID=2851010 RepID=UPI001C210757|nr:TetR/AcrR family transcriptional regulator [Leucobacter chinensis]
MSPTTQPSENRRGRPSVINRDAIGEVAFRLWDEQGFAATTWRDISEASGVSVRTLTRHFNSQLDLVSMGVDAAAERLNTALAEAPSDAPLDTLLRELVTQAVAVDTQTGNIPLIWQRVLSAEPLLRSAFRTVSESWTAELAGAITERSPNIPATTARAIAAALHAAASSALLDWAMAGGNGDAAEAVADALSWITVLDPAPGR